ncbi:melanophilin a isoform X2 [Cynoglossus semilaevis]|uniref:Melanophilin a n=1 Tax=Cynoglossus semilaevis TaxID=244447 RepID=A0A3P8VLN3_CYNSE|nr:melanophilin-like isoform X2 [Cynoglossus semilaevis]
MERKLDLSRLTDEEAKHVWEVIQRDFNLRKKEEERLGDLKTKIEKEDTKQELLVTETQLSDSLCIRCLQPFKFLLNSRRQCLDCHMFTCKSCSRYNKKEHGWVCDNCRMTRVLKIGTAGWYHDNVRNRFKRFGSAKVMRSLYKRLNGEGHDDDTQSMPDVQNYMYNTNDDDHGDGEGQRYKMMRKNKRLLSVHPLDFDFEEYAPHSRRASIQMQEERFYRNEMDFDPYNPRTNRRKSLDRYAMRPEELFDNRMVQTRSLSKISSSVARQQYVDTSDEDEFQRFPPGYQHVPPSHRRRNSRTLSQENLGQAPPINDLNKRMLAIENLLSRLEEKMVPDEEVSTPSGQNEEEKLRRKLSELAGHLSEKGGSSDEEVGKKILNQGKSGANVRGGATVKLHSKKDKDLSSSSDELPTESQKVYVTAGQSYDLEAKLRKLEQNAKNRFGGTTDSELSELEDVVALTAARVQSAESEVSDIESKIAALSVGGSKKKTPSSHQRKKSSQDVSKSNGAQWRPNNA